MTFMEAPHAFTASSDSESLSAVASYLRGLQERLVTALQALDSVEFLIDDWQKPVNERGLSGQGSTRVIEGGQVFERGGVNFSYVRGTALPASAMHGKRAALAGCAFEASGVSLVMHPRNPHVPTVHMNVRCFVAHAPSGPVAWFGGGLDLTPYYPQLDDIQHFHRVCQTALATHDVALYPAFKTWCDRYFYLPHRQETRGAGGIFFDDFDTPDFAGAFAVLRSVGDAFLPAYLPLVEKRGSMNFTPCEREFQAYRRGRYVEFNLLFDRGTLFGLQSGGRTESILMSMPPQASWRYDWQPEPGTPEYAIVDVVTRPRDWLTHA